MYGYYCRDGAREERILKEQKHLKKQIDQDIGDGKLSQLEGQVLIGLIVLANPETGGSRVTPEMLQLFLPTENCEAIEKALNSLHTKHYIFCGERG